MTDLLAAWGIKPCPDFSRLRTVLLGDGQPDYVPFYELFVNAGVMEKILLKQLPNRAATVEFYYRAGYDDVPAWPGIDLVGGSLVDTSSDSPIVVSQAVTRWARATASPIMSRWRTTWLCLKQAGNYDK